MNPQLLPPPEFAGAPQPLWVVLTALSLAALTVGLTFIASSILL